MSPRARRCARVRACESIPAPVRASSCRKNCAAVGGFAALRMRRAPCGYSTAFRPEENSRASTAYSVFPVLPGGRRPRKVRLAPFPPVEIGQPSGALLPYGCRIPLAGEGCAREPQGGETGEVPPVADKTSLFRGRPPIFGRKAHGNRLGRRCIPAPRGGEKAFSTR